MTEVYMSVKLGWNIKNSIMVLLFFKWVFFLRLLGPTFPPILQKERLLSLSELVSLSFFLWILISTWPGNLYLDYHFFILFFIYSFLQEVLCRMFYGSGIKTRHLSAPSFKISLRENKFWISLISWSVKSILGKTIIEGESK